MRKGSLVRTKYKGLPINLKVFTSSFIVFRYTLGNVPSVTLKKNLFFKKNLKTNFSELIFKGSLFNQEHFFFKEGCLKSSGSDIFKVRGALGFVYCGIIKNVEEKLNASFVYIGRSKNGFLHWNDSLFNKITGYFTHKFLNKKTLVQVLKEEFGTKGCRLTNNITLPGKLLILTPFSKNYGISKKIKNLRERFFLKKALKKISNILTTGVVIRTDTRFEHINTVLKDLNFLLNKWYFLKRKSDLNPSKAYLVNQNFKVFDGIVKGFIYKKFSRIVTSDLYLYNFFLSFFKKVSGFLVRNLSLNLHAKKTIKNTTLYESKVKLPSGGNIVFEETEALTSVDVNTGSHKSNKDGEAFSLKVNIEASKKIVEEVILKNISGLIIVDFVDMGGPFFDKKVFKALKRLFFLNNGLLKIKILPMSKLGIMQLTRQRDVESKFKFYFQKCYYCRGTGTVHSIKYLSNCLNDKVSTLLILISSNRIDLENYKVIRVHLNIKLFYFLKKKYINYFAFLKTKFKVVFLFKPDLNLHLDKFFIKYKING